MIEQAFTEAERRRLLALAMHAVPLTKGDEELVNIIAKISGTDTVLVARRAYFAPQVELG